MKPNQPAEFPLTRSAKIAAWYMLIDSTLSLMMLVFASRPRYTGVANASGLHLFDDYCGSAVLEIGYAIAGIGILRGKRRARKLGLALLIVNTVESANAFAWGFANGRPTPKNLTGSLIVSLLWHGLWIYLLYRKSRLSHVEQAPDPVLLIGSTDVE